MNKSKKFLINLIPKREFRKILRRYYKELQYKSSPFFIYNQQKYPMFQHEYNCGFMGNRITERCIEIAIARLWLEKINGDILEIGAVTPYYFPRAVNNICDPYDKHPKVDLKCSMFDLDLHGKNVISISTIEHIATGDYNVEIRKNESAVFAFEKIVNEAANFLITFPIGYNKELDEYFINKSFDKLNRKLKISLYKRIGDTNEWVEFFDFLEIKNIKYGQTNANGIVIIENA